MPGFNISNFRSNGLRLGGARPSLFVVTLQFPTISEIAPNTSNRAQFLCSATSIPASSIDKVPVGYFGRKIQLAGDRVFQDWQVRVLNDEDFQIRNAMEAWHNSINSIISNRLDPRVANISPQIGNSYKTTAMVTQLSKTGPGDIDGDGALKTYKFDGIFPTEVDPIRLDWNSTNQIEEFDVTFAYDWWEPMRKGNEAPIFPIEQNPA